MAPLLQQEDRAAGARAVRDHRELRRFDQGRVFAAVDEPGEIAVVLVRPARGLLRDRRDVVQRGDCRASGLEDDVVRASRQPEDGVVLRRRHPVAIGAHDVRVETLKTWWRVVGCDRTPEVGTEAGDEVDAAHRRARLAQRGDRGDECSDRLLRVHRTRDRRATACRARTCLPARSLSLWSESTTARESWGQTLTRRPRAGSRGRSPPRTPSGIGSRRCGRSAETRRCRASAATGSSATGRLS